MRKPAVLLLILNIIAYILVTEVKGMTVEGMNCFCCIGALTIASYKDIRVQEVPLSCTFLFYLTGMIHLLGKGEGLLIGLMGGILLFGFFSLIYRISGGRLIGGGDVKFMGAAGLFLGWEKGLYAFILSCFMALGVQILLLPVKGWRRTFPFMPYLSLGFFLFLLYGDEILKIYGFSNEIYFMV